MAENKTADNKTNQGSFSSYLLSLAFFWLNVLSMAAFSFFMNCPVPDLIRNVCLIAIVSSLFIFLFTQGREEDLLLYDNIEHPFRVFIWFFIGIILEGACVFLPVTGWPLVPAFVTMALYSTPLMGVVSGTSFLLGAVLLTDSSMSVFLLYFVSGLVGICMFNKLDERYKVMVPLVVTGLSLLVNETAEIIIFENATLSFERFLIPVANVFVSVLFIVIVLKIFSSQVIYKNRDRYMELNDPECKLLVELKEKNKDEYYKSIHVAYFCDKIAKKLGLDDGAAKAGGYYQSIGIIKGDKSWGYVSPICEEYKFPTKARQILKEYLTGTGLIVCKETGILYFSDAVITTILYLIKNGQTEIDYNQVIDSVFKKKQASPRFARSALSVDELRIMKQLFIDERLYYDFLR
ncbi:MAG: hypothetical protein IKY04_04850 [Lachnospiraceae bacterium]|nr:hypothetical protein [Lachnospiraceae bacterium]MBR4993557.1 hypothetical protein [Lachnospiraceae bacterium]